MRLFNKVAIIGTGLIGGSIGLEIKSRHLAGSVVGVTRHACNITMAVNTKAIDHGSTNLSVIKGADLVILAAPVEVILKLAPKIARLIDKNTIVTDVASTKQKVVSRLEKIFTRFVGVHPLAGSEKKGVVNAYKGMFKNSLCIFTPTGKTDKKALVVLKSLWGRLGARLIEMQPKAHDEVLAFTSHLPHAVAFSLISAVPQKHINFSSCGLRDTTRIASSDSALWAEIFLSNSGNLLKAIGGFENNLRQIKIAVKQKDKVVLTSLLKKAQLKRQNLS